LHEDGFRPRKRGECLRRIGKGLLAALANHVQFFRMLRTRKDWTRFRGKPILHFVDGHFVNRDPGAEFGLNRE